GDGRRRLEDGNTAGSVATAGFVVGEQQPLKSSDGTLSHNPHANVGGPEGRLYFLGAFMSESVGSTVFSSARLQGTGSVTPGVNTAVPIIRGVIMAASGVIPRLSASIAGVASDPPASTYVASNDTTSGSILGNVVLLENNVAKQD